MERTDSTRVVLVASFDLKDVRPSKEVVAELEGRLARVGFHYGVVTQARGTAATLTASVVVTKAQPEMSFGEIQAHGWLDRSDRRR